MTLVEILVVVAVLAILAALSFPLLNSFGERQKAVQCLTNLKTLAAATQLVAQENNGIITVFRTGNGSFDLRWKTQWEKVMGFTEPVKSGPKSPFLCPCLPESPVPHWQCYGLIMTPPPGTNSSNAFTVRLAELTQPSKTPLFADSVDAGGRQIFRITSRSSASVNGVHLRHSGGAHMAFYDGHVEKVSPERLAELGFRQARDENLKIIDLPAAQ